MILVWLLFLPLMAQVLIAWFLLVRWFFDWLDPRLDRWLRRRLGLPVNDSMEEQS